MKASLLTLWILVLYALHQDMWNWNAKSPLLFGLLPPGLTYHAAYSIIAALTMALLVRCAWPKDLDADEQPSAKYSQS